MKNAIRRHAYALAGGAVIVTGMPLVTALSAHAATLGRFGRYGIGG